jgi:hypothetical protein
VGYDGEQGGGFLLELEDDQTGFELLQPDGQLQQAPWGLNTDEVKFLGYANQGMNLYDSFTTDRILTKWAASTGNERMAQLVAQQDYTTDESREQYDIFVNQFWPDCVAAGLIDASAPVPQPPISITDGPHEIPWTQTQEYREQMQAYERQQAMQPVDVEEPYAPAEAPEINPTDYADATEENNAAALKATPEGGQVSFIQRGRVVLIGNSHDSQLRDWVLSDPTGATISGVIAVEKGGVFSAGRLNVSTSGPGGRRMEFEQAIAAISKKEVVWV